jgi:hypothetical protein
MATKSTDELVVGGDGTIYVAPLSTASPAIGASAWDPAWINLGYANPDGVQFTDTRTLQIVDVWQLFYPARRIVTARDFTVGFKLAQWDKDTVPLAFGGGSVTVSGTGHRYTPPDPATIDTRALGVEWLDGTKLYRFVMPKCFVTTLAQVDVKRTDAALLPITVGVVGQAGVAPWYLDTNDPSFA